MGSGQMSDRMGQQASDISVQSGDGQNQSSSDRYNMQQDQGQADGTSYENSTETRSSEKMNA
jgi:hypothetical protein